MLKIVGTFVAFFTAVGVIWLGGLVYCLLAIVSARRFRNGPSDAATGVAPAVPVSLLKPLSGMERDLEENLESFFLQDYPNYEILFAVNREDDPALFVVERLRRRYPERHVEVLTASDSPYPNAKVYSMELMARQARGEVLVISDSDVRVTPDYLRTVVQPFLAPAAGKAVGVVTCPYRGAPGTSLWSRLEALGMTTRFMPGILVAWAMEDRSPSGMQFALGPTMAIRRECLEAIGGFTAMGNYLADDFVLGKWAAEHGYRVVLSPYVLDHLVLGEDLAATFLHQLRWARSTRCSRPWGYIGEGFTHPTAISLLAAWALLYARQPAAVAASMVAASLVLRWWVAWEVGWNALRDPELRRSWWLVPLGDLLGFAIWLGGFTGRTILWRGIEYRVGQDGRFEPVVPVEVPEGALLAPIAEHELAAARGEHVHGAGRQ